MGRDHTADPRIARPPAAQVPVRLHPRSFQPGRPDALLSATVLSDATQADPPATEVGTQADSPHAMGHAQAEVASGSRNPEQEGRPSRSTLGTASPQVTTAAE